jgi:hypothetical protein
MNAHAYDRHRSIRVVVTGSTCSLHQPADVTGIDNPTLTVRYSVLKEMSINKSTVKILIDIDDGLEQYHNVWLMPNKQT